MFNGKIIEVDASVGRGTVKSRFENSQSLQLMLNMIFVIDAFLEISLKFSEMLCQRAILFSCSGYSQRNGCITQRLIGSALNLVIHNICKFKTF